MRKKILITLAVLAGILLILVGIIAMQPADYTVTRSAAIKAPADTVYAQVNDFHNWDAWSPWAKLDPNAKNSFEGPSSGTGAIFKWSGNDEVGEGKMTITDAKPNDYIKIKLDFVRPFEDTSNVVFTFKPQADDTLVTWTMNGHKGFISKAVCMFMDMDKMLGGDFEKGLASLQTVVFLKSGIRYDPDIVLSATETAPATKPSKP